MNDFVLFLKEYWKKESFHWFTSIFWALFVVSWFIILLSLLVLLKKIGFSRENGVFFGLGVWGLATWILLRYYDWKNQKKKRKKDE